MSDRDFILHIAVRKAVDEYRSKNEEETKDKTDERIWEYLKDRPFTIGNYVQSLTNETIKIAELQLRISKLEEEIGVLKKKGSSGEGIQSPSGDVVH